LKASCLKALPGFHGRDKGASFVAFMDQGDGRMPDIRKLVYLREESFAEAGRTAPRPIIRAVALILIGNPYAGPAVSYGKGAIVGAAGELEHAAAILHPALGRPLREAIGGGAAIIPSAAKMGGPGSALDLPLGHKDDVWSRGHFDAITVSLGDGPRPDEILVVIGLADGGRLLHRIGEGAPR
jgi:hypothetical protein